MQVQLRLGERDGGSGKRQQAEGHDGSEPRWAALSVCTKEAASGPWCGDKTSRKDMKWFAPVFRPSLVVLGAAPFSVLTGSGGAGAGLLHAG